MPLDEKQKEYLLIGGVAVAVLGLFVALRKGSSVAGQSLAGNRAPTPGQPGYQGSAAANDLGKAYLDYQFKNQQLTAQTANFQAQLASTDARAKLSADTQLEIAHINTNASLESGIAGGALPIVAKLVERYLPGKTPNPNANGTNNSLAPPSKETIPAGISGSPSGISNYAAALAAASGNPLGVDDPNSSILARHDQVFGPPSAPATPGVGWPSINGLVGNENYQTTPMLSFLTGNSAQIPYESYFTVTPAEGTPSGLSQYFSAPPTYEPSYPSIGYDYGSPDVATADLGNGSSDVGYEGSA